MMWMLYALGAPFFFSVVNHFDKYLLRRYVSESGSRVLIIFSSLIGGIVAPVIFFFHADAFLLPLQDSIFLLASGVLFILALYPYFMALERGDASLVVPLFQLIPLFAYGLGFVFLGETLSVREIAASFIIMTGAIGISIDTEKTRWRIRWPVLGLIALSSFLFSLDSVLFKSGAMGGQFWVSAGWQYTGFFLPGAVILLVSRADRLACWRLVRTNPFSVVGLNGANELVNLAAKLFLNYASLLAPVSLVWVVNGFQPFFVFFLGFLLTVWMPNIAKEDIRPGTVIRKLACTGMMVAGAFFLQP